MFYTYYIYSFYAVKDPLFKKCNKFKIKSTLSIKFYKNNLNNIFNILPELV